MAGVAKKAREFVLMQTGQGGENSASPRGEVNADHSAVRTVFAFEHEPVALRPIHERDHGVVPVLKKFGQIRHGGPSGPGEARDAEHELVLQRRDARGACGALAEPQESSQTKPKLRQLMDDVGRRLVTRFGGRAGRDHFEEYITS